MAFNHKKLPENRQALYAAIKILVEHNEGVMCATPEIMKQTLESIEAGDFDEGNWFAMEYQGGPIIDKAYRILKEEGVAT